MDGTPAAPATAEGMGRSGGNGTGSVASGDGVSQRRNGSARASAVVAGDARLLVAGALLGERERGRGALLGSRVRHPVGASEVRYGDRRGCEA